MHAGEPARFVGSEYATALVVKLAVVIVIVVLVNAVVGFLQEGKAEESLDAIRDMIAPHALALRGGARTDIEVADRLEALAQLVDEGLVIEHAGGYRLGPTVSR